MLSHQSDITLQVQDPLLTSEKDEPSNPPVYTAEDAEAALTERQNTINRCRIVLNLIPKIASITGMETVGAMLWQLVDDFMGGEQFSEGSGFRYAVRCASVGLGQTVGSSGTNFIPACFQILDGPDGWEIGTNFLAGALWIPFKDAGEGLGNLIWGGSPYSLKRIATTMGAIMLGTGSTHVISEKLKQCFKKKPVNVGDILENKEESKDIPESKKTSKVAPILGSGMFFLQGATWQPGSDQGNRDAVYAGAYSGAGALAGQAMGEVFEKCKKKEESNSPRMPTPLD